MTLAGSIVALGAAAELPRTFVWQADDLVSLRHRVADGDRDLEPALRKLSVRADMWLGLGPWTVTSKGEDYAPAGGTVHDYVSLNKYWWPCTASPEASLASTGGDPFCSMGVLHVGDLQESKQNDTTNVCCPAACASCGIDACANATDPCCLPNIVPKNMSCNEYVAPCIMDPNVCNESSGLPYKEHDGYVNPETLKYDHDALLNMTESVAELSLAAYYLDKDIYAEHAARILRTWFLNESTRMNPSVEFGHWTPGWCDQKRPGEQCHGDHGAFIDTHWNPELLDAAALLHFSHPRQWKAEDQAGLLTWFDEYLHWANTSAQGLGEQGATNNHGLWYDAQIMAVALHVNSSEVVRDIARQSGPGRIALQVTPEGAMPQEEARTKAFSYSNFALNALMHTANMIDLCRQPGGACEGVGSLYEYVAPNGASLRKVLEYQLPFVLRPETWPFQQVEPFVASQGCSENMVDQCVTTYFWPFRKAARAFGNRSFEDAIPQIEGVDYKSSLVNLVAPRFSQLLV